jgi:hypothetical protein
MQGISLAFSGSLEVRTCELLSFVETLLSRYPNQSEHYSQRRPKHATPAAETDGGSGDSVWPFADSCSKNIQLTCTCVCITEFLFVSMPGGAPGRCGGN